MIAPKTKRLWTDDCISQLIKLKKANKDTYDIARALHRSAISVEKKVTELRGQGRLPPIRRMAVDKAPPIAAATRAAVNATTEADMIARINTMGGYPVERTVAVRGQKVKVWTTASGLTLHPLFRTKLFGPTPAGAA